MLHPIWFESFSSLGQRRSALTVSPLVRVAFPRCSPASSDRVVCVCVFVSVLPSRRTLQCVPAAQRSAGHAPRGEVADTHTARLTRIIAVHSLCTAEPLSHRVAPHALDCDTAHSPRRRLASPLPSPLLSAAMVLYNFKSIGVVPGAKDFIDIVLSRTQRKTPTVVHQVRRGNDTDAAPLHCGCGGEDDSLVSYRCFLLVDRVTKSAAFESFT